MKGNDVAIQPEERGQTMEGWEAKTVTTTASVQGDKRRLEEVFVEFQRFNVVNNRLWGYLDLRQTSGDRGASASGGWTKRREVFT